MFPTIKATLPIPDIAANIVTEARDGSTMSGDSGVLSLFHYQRTSRIVMIVDQCHMQKPTGQFLNMCIEDLALEAGLYGVLLTMYF